MEDSVLITRLHQACGKQLALYRQLCDFTQRMLQRLVMSRGDMTGLRDVFEQKRRLVGEIERERAGMHELAGRWQERKSQVVQCAATRDLDTLFGSMETAIRKYLELEAQVRTYLEHAVGTGTTPDGE